MQLAYTCLWVRDLTRMTGFYQSNFQASVSERRCEVWGAVESACLLFENGASLKLLQANADQTLPAQGSFAVGAGRAADVDRLTEQLAAKGCTILAEPRLSMDGYYESVVTDPEGNPVIITI